MKMLIQNLHFLQVYKYFWRQFVYIIQKYIFEKAKYSTRVILFYLYIYAHMYIKLECLSLTYTKTPILKYIRIFKQYNFKNNSLNYFCLFVQNRLRNDMKFITKRIRSYRECLWLQSGVFYIPIFIIMLHKTSRNQEN